MLTRPEEVLGAWVAFLIYIHIIVGCTHQGYLQRKLLRRLVETCMNSIYNCYCSSFNKAFPVLLVQRLYRRIPRCDSLDATAPYMDRGAVSEATSNQQAQSPAHFHFATRDHPAQPKTRCPGCAAKLREKK